MRDDLENERPAQSVRIGFHEQLRTEVVRAGIPNQFIRRACDHDGRRARHGSRVGRSSGDQVGNSAIERRECDTGGFHPVCAGAGGGKLGHGGAPDQAVPVAPRLAAKIGLAKRKRDAADWCRAVCHPPTNGRQRVGNRRPVCGRCDDDVRLREDSHGKEQAGNDARRLPSGRRNQNFHVVWAG